MAKRKINAKNVLTEARGWLGTPFHHQGRLKGVGVDCIGVAIGVGHACGLTTFDIDHYGRLPQGDMILREMRANADLLEVGIHQKQPGDLLVFSFERDAQHLAILTENNTIIHAYQTAKCCVENGFQSPWTERLLAVFRFKRVAKWRR